MKKKLLILTVLTIFIAKTNGQINLLRNFANGNAPANFFIHNNKLYFSASEINMNNTELWVYDGSEQVSSTNPKIVIDLDNNSNTSTVPKNFVTYNGKLFFSNNNNLFCYDDNVIISVNNPKIIGNRGNGLIIYNSKLYYEEASTFPNSWLWVYDDNIGLSTSNPKKITDNPQINSTSIGFRFKSKIFNNQLLYCGSNLNDQNYELYSYNSLFAVSSTNPKRVSDINLGAIASTPNDFIIFQNKLLFTANDGTGNELWSYDNVNTPVKAFDLDTSPYGGTFSNKVIYDNKLYFTGKNNLGLELYRYDLLTNPQIIADIYAGTNSSIPNELTVYDNKLFFTADNGTNGRELWLYDSQLATSSVNPRMIEIFAGSNSGIDSNGTDIIEYNNNLYFSGRANSNNTSIFTTNSANLKAENFIEKSKLKIYPNPASELITIESTDQKLKNIAIYNSLGQTIYDKSLNEMQEQISIKNKGIYYIKIRTVDDKYIMEKIILK